MNSSVFIGQQEHFNGITKIPYEGHRSTNPLAFKHYEAERRVGDKTMQEHLRFAVCYWHSFCGAGADPFGLATRHSSWQQKLDDHSLAEARLDAAFEFISKLGAPYYCFHDVDFIAEGSNLLETEARLAKMVDLAKVRQDATGIRLLWGIANLCTHPRYANGAATNPDFKVLARAGAAVKATLHATQALNGENFVFWNGREGYASLTNTSMKREREHLARFLTMTRDYGRSIGFQGDFLIEPKPVEPMRQHYDVDASTVIAFLREFDLHRDFKLNIEANHATLAGHSFVHDVQVCADANMLGSIDANFGNAQNRWDTVHFPTRIQHNIELMLCVLRIGGMPRGGLNLDAKLRRESTAPEDLFIAHIGAMDAFACALKIAHALLHQSELENWRRERYRSFDDGLGARFAKAQLSLIDLHQYALQMGEPRLQSARQEAYENLVNQFLYRHPHPTSH
jgi:xylose isomerase